METLESEQSTSRTAASVLFRSRRSSDHAFFKGLSSLLIVFLCVVYGGFYMCLSDPDGAHAEGDV